MQRRSHGDGWMILKIVLEKTYDRLRWDFILHSLRLAGFPSSWLTIISNYLSSFSMRVLWNNQHFPRFQPSRGVCQRDPLAPYLFVSAIERLGHLITQSVANGSWVPIQLSHQCPPYLIFSLLMISCYLLRHLLSRLLWLKNVLMSFVLALGKELTIQSLKFSFH